MLILSGEGKIILHKERRDSMIRPFKLLGWVWIILFLFIGFYQEGWAKEFYLVKPGDTLCGISKSFGVSIDALKKANSLEGDSLKPKQVLSIPTQRDEKLDEAARKSLSQTDKQLAAKNVKKLSEGADSYVVQSGDSLYTISKKVGLSIEEIKKRNGLHTSTLKIGQTLLLAKSERKWEEEAEELGDGEDVAGSSQTEGEREEGTSSVVLGKWNNPEERSLFVRVVKTFLGVPYKLGGSTLKGIDCSAFVKKIYEIFNIQLPRTTREQLSIGKEVEKDKLEEGDLVFFKRRGNNAHVGIYIGDNQFIHASSRNKEVKIDQLDIPYFNTRFIKGVRVKELEREI
jgi:cell wall-associated NlpC family hydrolase